jgi:hypothetical protein
MLRCHCAVPPNPPTRTVESPGKAYAESYEILKGGYYRVKSREVLENH